MNTPPWRAELREASSFLGNTPAPGKIVPREGGLARNNPVRNSYVQNPEEWPYRGEIHQFGWHD